MMLIEMTRRVRFAAVAILCTAATLAEAQVPETSEGNAWAEAAAASGYAEATVSEPRFEDEEVWPLLTGEERYLEQDLGGGRTLVYARPGESAEGGGEIDPWDGANWIDAGTGEPLSGELSIDEETDLVLPAADDAYIVKWRKPDGSEKQFFDVRSVTVQPNAGWSSAGLNVYGNLWIKRGARFGNHGSVNFTGPNDTFFRNDNTHPLDWEGDSYANNGVYFAQYYGFSKAADASVELLGHSRVGDECGIKSGTVIIGPDSVMQPGRNAVPYIASEATLALADGAVFAKWCNQIHFLDLRVEGTLQGGLPERPLQRDAYVGLSYQNSNGTDFRRNGRHVWPEKKKLNERTASAVFAAPGSRLRSYSTDPAQASLVLTWHGIEAINYFSKKLLFRRLDEADQQFFRQQLDSLPKYVSAAFAEDVQVEGVRFDRFLEGGILLTDPSVRNAWEDVQFGDDNQAPREQLFREVDVDLRSGAY